MSKGSPIVSLRVPQEMLDIVDNEIQIVNRSKVKQKFDRSLFILTAVCEKLAHLERGRRRSKRGQVDPKRCPSLLGIASAEPAASLLLLLRQRAAASTAVGQTAGEE